MSVKVKSLLSIILALTMILSMGIFSSAEAACAHKLIRVPAKEGDGINTGNIEYYKCSVCGEVFADKDGKNPIVCTAVSVFPTATGNIGVNVNYTLYNNGDLVIYGEGPTYDYYGEKDVPSPFAGGPMNNDDGQARHNYAVYDAIKKVIVKEGVTELGNELFRGSSVTEAVLPSSLIRIGRRTFMNSKISKINFSEGLQFIDGDAFCYCSQLNEVHAPESLKVIKDGAFYKTPFYDNLGPGKHKLGSVLLKDNSYTGAVTLETYKIDDGITCICDNFLPYAVKVKNFEAPDSLIYAGYYSVGDNWIGINKKPGSVYLGKVLLICNDTEDKADTAEIKPGTVSIASRAFFAVTYYKTLKIPDSVKYIGEFAFANSNLHHITLPANLKVIEKYTFYNTRMEEINFPDSLERIEEGAFQEARLTKAIISDNVITIAPEAFEDCHYLEKIHIPFEIRRIGAEAFMNTKKLSSIENTDPVNLEHVGTDTFTGCKQYENFMYFDLYFGKVLYKYRERYDRNVPENFVIKKGTVSITDNALKGIKGIKSIEIPDSVRYIGSFALSANQNVKINKLPGNLTYLGSFGLDYVHADSLHFPGNLISLGYYDVNNHSMMNIKCDNITCPKGSAADKMLAEYDPTSYTPIENKALHVLEAVKEKAPTCSETGMKAHYECAVCGKLFKENDESTAVTAKELEIPMKPHTPVAIPAVPATCTKTGLTEGKKCSVCGKILTEQQVVGKKPHTPGKVQKENVVEASYGKDGSYDEVVYCTVCKTEISRKTVKIPGKPLIMGDADGDSKITASDARLALRFSVGLEKGFTELQLLAADTDKDKKITAADARLILRASVGLEKLK